MFRGARIVAGPVDGVALAAGVPRARQHDRRAASPASASRPSYVAREFCMPKTLWISRDRRCAVRARSSTRWSVSSRASSSLAPEDRRLVHVVPEAGDALADEVWRRRAPPGARAVRVKSGKTLPGQTLPTYTEPSAFLTKWFPAIPSS